MKANSRTRKSGSDLSRTLREELERLGAPRLAVDPAAVKPMKPETRDTPFSRPGWVFELKYDGFRMLASGGAGEARLFYKSGHDATRIFPELAQAVAALPLGGLLMDGEAVALDAEGRPSFQRLQRRGLRTRLADVQHAAAAAPATLFVFDLLAFEDFDLRPLPLSARKEILRKVVPPDNGWIRLTEEIPERGEDLYAAVAGMGLEGMVAKRSDSPYRAGYSPDWLKVRVDQSSDFAVVGYETVVGDHTGFRRLHLAVQGDEGLAYAGTVGTGFNRQDQAEIRSRLDPRRRPTPPVTVPAGKGPVWVEPELVVEVRYKEITEGGHLRHPVFLRLRHDKAVEDCWRLGWEGGEEEKDLKDLKDQKDLKDDREEEGEKPSLKSLKSLKSLGSFTNLDKIFWPEEGITKGDLIEYYRAVSPWMLPFLKDRPLMLERYPDGIHGKYFHQKSLPKSETLLCESVEELLYLVNLGAIPFHIGASRLGSIERPDWCILDLDPKTAPFSHVVRIALAVRELCEEIGLPSFVKTSGGSGLHILLPMGRLLAHEPVRQLAELLAGVIVARLPEIATTARSIQARKGKVYVDALQNGRGKLLAAPYAARPVPAASVSTPLEWSEVNARLDVHAFNVRTVPKRLRRGRADPLRPVLELEPDLERTLALLAERV
ncbi:MAG: DNA ligase D [Thermoanaerobaculia bacterium]